MLYISAINNAFIGDRKGNNNIDDKRKKVATIGEFMIKNINLLIHLWHLIAILLVKKLKYDREHRCVHLVAPIG